MGKTFWRSVEEFCESPEFRSQAEREFASFLPETSDTATRRRFLKLMGASMALASVAGCNNPTWPRWPKAKILPYAFRPEGVTPGTPRHFATCMELGGVAKPLLVKSYDGRPIKIEGNPEHPASRGAADLIAQASILSLYDPDRSKGVAQRGSASPVPWQSFFDAARPVFQKHRPSRGQGLRVLTEATSSPSFLETRARFAESFPEAVWHEYESVSRDNVREGARLAFGRPLRVQYDLTQADVIASFDDDFLMEDPNALVHARDWAARRRPENGALSRLSSIESAYSITGSLADERHPLVPSAICPSLWNLAAHLVLQEHVELPPELSGLHGLLQKSLGRSESFPWSAKLAKELARSRSHSLLTVGPSQPPSAHALAHALNVALGNIGHTVSMTEEIGPERGPHVDSIASLVDAMNAKEVETLVILGGNPVYDAPGDLAFGKALAEVPFSCHLSLSLDETSQECAWHLPRAHYLEAFSDARSWDGTYTIAQPLIDPFYGGKTPAELLTVLHSGAERSARAIVEETFAKSLGGGPKEWKRAVHDGFAAGTALPHVAPGAFRSDWTPRDAEALEVGSAGERMEVLFRADYKVYDGRFANNGWLQELPDPMTKLTWDNAALINPVEARELGVKQGDVLELSFGDQKLRMPAYLMPGQARGSIAVALGHGRAHGGHVARSAGFDVHPARTTETMAFAPSVELRVTGERYPLSSTQNHHAITNAEQGRGQERRLPQLVRESTYDEWQHHPEAVKHAVHHPPLLSLWEEHRYDGHKWGMSIDLSTCIGCGACVVACQAENNVPIVGKKEVSRGREMHWIRVDRYFKGDDLEMPEVAHQVVTCHQCENAPCEQVCPFTATTHSAEGLNDMVYNRCVGTRYCSNNCPYKVRRFNWFNNTRKPYNDHDLFKMQRNPDVTVRSRGVMEKCTYCVQRIKAVTIPAKNAQLPVKDGEIVPACAQTCPTRAIVFGDLNDPTSRVRKAQELPRSYHMLEELNVKPRTFYLAKIRSSEGAGSSFHHEDAEKAG
jgi:molybdopterin-containing oxidoreductase family iron-sulfur binding subunit